MRLKAVIASAALALVLGTVSLLAAEIVSVSVTPSSLTIAQGGTGSFSASIDSISGSVPPKPHTLPTVSYCAEYTIHADGTITCDTPGLFTLVKARNYSQDPLTAGELTGPVTINVDAGAPCNTVYQLEETFTANGGSGVDFGNEVMSVTKYVAVTVSCAGVITAYDGCSHGYWKNHTSNWPAPYTPTTKLRDAFVLASFYGALSNTTLEQALDFKGGNTDLEKAQILLRNAVAGVLNSAQTGINYFTTTSQLIATVNAALATGDRATMLALEAQLDAANQNSAFCDDSSTGQ